MPKPLWPIKVVKVSDLFLDELNIRLDMPTGSISQDALISDLFNNQAALKLAEGISRNSIFQHELPIVVEEKGKLVVLEGNRRVAALKGLYNPNLVPSFSPRLEVLRKNNTNLPITHIEVKVAPHRDEVIQLLASVHTTESRKPWSTLRQAYFYYALIESKKRTLTQLIKDFPGVKIPRFIKMWEMHRVVKSIKYDTPVDDRKVANQQTFPISTLERVYENEKFQKDYGVVFAKTGRVKITAERKSFEHSVKQIVQDILSRDQSSRTLNKTEDINKYLEKIPKPKLKRTAAPLGSSSFTPTAVPPRVKKAKGLIPKDVVCNLNSPGLRKILKELQDLDYATFPNAAHDLLRTLLECSLKAYFQQVGETVPHSGQYVYLKDVLSHAEKYFVTVERSLVQPIKVLRAAAGNVTEKYLYSEDYLNALNHNHNVFSTGERVKDAWDHIEPIIRYVLNPPTPSAAS